VRMRLTCTYTSLSRANLLDIPEPQSRYFMQKGPQIHMCLFSYLFTHNYCSLN